MAWLCAWYTRVNRVKYPGASSNGEMLRREQEAVDGGKETCCSHEITPGDLEQPPLLSELLAAARSVHPCGWVLCGGFCHQDSGLCSPGRHLPSVRLWKMMKSRPWNFPSLHETASWNLPLCPGHGSPQTPHFGRVPLVFIQLPLFSFFWFTSLLSHTLYFLLQLLNRKDKTTFEKLDYLMSKEDNYKRTREYIRSLKMVPSIPYLGRSLNWLIIF